MEIVWSSPRLILLASGFSRYDQYAVNRIDERIELWTYTFYDGNLLGVDLLSSEEVASTKTKTASSKTAAKVKSSSCLSLSMRDGRPSALAWDWRAS